MRKLTLLFLTILAVGFMAGFADIPVQRNSSGEIKNKLDKITLKTIRIWGEEDENADENYFFKNPIDVAHDSQNNFYVLDNNLHCIKVFAANGEFLRQFGEKGQGPESFLSPFNMGIDDKDQVWVVDWGNRRFQVLSTTGKSLAVIRSNVFYSHLLFPGNNQMAYCESESGHQGKGIIKVLDRAGKVLAIIGAGMLPPKVDCPWAGGEFDWYQVAYGKKKEKYYIATKYTQMIQSFQKDGKLCDVIFYDTPINQELKMVWDSKKNNFDLPRKAKQYSECVDIAIDDNGLIFIVVTTREPAENEIMSMVLVNSSFFYKPPQNFPEKTDRYRLMVFGPDGKVVAVTQLNTYCSGIYIHKNRLFILDTAFNGVIYEYKYAIR